MHVLSGYANVEDASIWLENMDSKLLSSIIDNKMGASYLQVVFVDTVSYSKRKSTIQKALVDTFTELAKKALLEISKDNVEYSQVNRVNFATDIVKIPTGDGLALVFPFEGLQRIHLDFACRLLEEIHTYNESNKCEKFDNHGWCNCHKNLTVRVGISEGKGIVYRDLNGGYNVAGTVINVAARIMGLADPMQIIVSEDTYKTVIDMTTDTALEDSFARFSDIEVKHGLKLNLYQYRADKDYLNKEEPADIVMNQKMNEVAKRLGMPRTADLPQEARKLFNKQMLGVMENMAAIFDESGLTKK